MTNAQALDVITKAIGEEDRYAIGQVVKARPDLWAFVRAADNYLLAHLNRSSETTIAGLVETLLCEKERLEAAACS